MWMVLYPILRHASCVGNFAEISDLVLAKARSSLLPPSSAIKKFLLIGARTQPAQDDTDSRRIPLPLRL